MSTMAITHPHFHQWVDIVPVAVLAAHVHCWGHHRQHRQPKEVVVIIIVSAGDVDGTGTHVHVSSMHLDQSSNSWQCEHTYLNLLSQHRCWKHMWVLEVHSAQHSWLDRVSTHQDERSWSENLSMLSILPTKPSECPNEASGCCQKCKRLKYRS